MTASGQRVLWDVGGEVGTSTTLEEAVQNLGIATQSKRGGPWGTQLQAVYTVTGTGISFTFQVKGTVYSQ